MADPMFVAQRHNASNQMSLNISDVIDVIGQDEEFGSSNQSVYGGIQMSGAPSTVPSEGNSFDPEVETKRKAYVKVIEQPQPKALRFRYICEGRSAGSIPGIRSNAENKTFPAIQVCGYTGPAVVVVSCVTVDPPYRPHPHNLVGKEGCKKGVCTMQINSDSMTCVFSNLGIQCVKKRDVEEALRLREEIRVDPFQTGFTHRNNPQSIDLNSVRLCFQVFLQGANKKHFTFPLKASVSEPIYDKKATSDLIICKLSDCTSSVAGGKEIILLCDKVTKEDIQVRFYEVKDGMIHWEAFGDFQASDVHKQVAISFKTPRYKVLEMENPVKTYIELVRPSDNMKSEPRPFTYLPLDSGRQFTSFKRLKNNYGLFQRILGLESPMAVDASQDNLVHKTPAKRTQDSLMEEVKIPATSHLTLNIPQVSSVTTDGNHVAPISAFASAPSGFVVTKPPSLARPVSPPLGSLGPNQSVDDIRQRMTASLRKGPGSGTTSPRPQQPKSSPFWSDDVSVYSDTDMLDEVLSQGSVNDLLSAVGEGLTVYEDVTGFSEPPNQNLSLLAPDAVYGDASYASCYSNLEFVMGQARAAQIAKSEDQPPILPPKRSNSNSMVIDDNEDYGLYETPSGLPIHPNKASLLQTRGFRIGGGVNTSGSPVVTKTEGSTASVDNALYYDPNQASHDLAELLDDPGTQPSEVNSEVVPRTILDLFV